MGASASGCCSKREVKTAEARGSKIKHPTERSFCGETSSCCGETKTVQKNAFSKAGAAQRCAQVEFVYVYIPKDELEKGDDGKWKAKRDKAYFRSEKKNEAKIIDACLEKGYAVEGWEDGDWVMCKKESVAIAFDDSNVACVQAFESGDCVRLLEDLEDPTLLRKGQQGIVRRVDEEGNLLINFGPFSQQVFKKNVGKLEKIEGLFKACKIPFVPIAPDSGCLGRICSDASASTRASPKRQELKPLDQKPVGGASPQSPEPHDLPVENDLQVTDPEQRPREIKDGYQARPATKGPGG